MKRAAWCILILIALSQVAQAQTFWPLLNSASPCAVQVGAQVECEFTTIYGHTGAYRVLVTGRGVTGEVVGAAPPSVLSAPMTPSRSHTKIKVRFTAAADAPLGPREVRLLTPNGPSSTGQIVVVRDPIVREAKANDSMKEAQAVTLPATLCGAIEARQDVDYYKFTVREGEALTFHVYCQRLLNKLTAITINSAPMITLRNAAGTVLASNDNFFGGDPLLHHRFVQGGEYYLEVRDVRYDGSEYWQYAIEIHGRPFVTTISPACLPPGQPTKVKLIGVNLPADPHVTVTLPADAHTWDQWLQLPSLAGQPLNSVLVRPNKLPLVHEGSTVNDAPAQAQVLTLPAAVAGVLEREGDVDCYAFQARKGDRFTFQIAARPLNSALDSILRILDGKGETLAENDDASDGTPHRDKRNEIMCADSRIENWEAPADGRYILEVSDVHGRGGPRFTYSLLARRAQPHFHLELSTDRTVLAPGVAGVIFVRSIRKEGFTGDIDLKVEGMPPGVKAVCGPIPGPCQDGCILLRSDGVKPRIFSSVRVIGKAKVAGADKSMTTQEVVARPYGELIVDGGARYLVPCDDHVVATVDALDLKSVRFKPGEITLKPGETKKIDVTVERRPGFQEAVTLSIASAMHVWVYGNCLPEGVTLDPSSLLRITGNQLTGTLILKAATNARPVRRQLIPIMGEVSINFSLRMYYAGDPLWLTVEEKR